jgi:integrase
LLLLYVEGVESNLAAHTMAFLDAFTGLRINELLALKWADIDFDKLEINVSRAIVYGVVAKCKSKASKKPLPLDPAMATALCGWRQLTPFNAPDWIFAGPKTDGRMPLTPDNLRRRHLQPAAKQAGFKGKVGWHTFRRTLASLFMANGMDVKATQELLRHANSKIVLDLYAQETTGNKRAAQSKVVEMVLPKPPQVVAAIRKNRTVPFCSHGLGPRSS